MKNCIFKRFVAVTMAIAMLFCNVIYVTAEPNTQIKNIIYMIPDGGAMASFFLADYVKQEGGLDEKFPNATPVNAEEMYIKDYLVGAETTHSANSSVTDSAASGTALSSSYKTNNTMIGITPQLKPRANILEACQEIGKNTGLVVTYEWTNATPAAFSAHANERGEKRIIAEQVVNQGIDVVFGNSDEDYKSYSWFANKSFEERGYKVIHNETDLKNIQPGDRVWGKLPQAYYDYQKAENTPNLAELTTAAIRALDDGNENGFFLMVEGSVIDGGGHASNALNMVSEWLAFDEACKVAIEYAKKRTDTLVIIMPDHDTGGIKYGDDYTKESLKDLTQDILAGTNPEGITWEGNGSHTGRNGGVFMYVPEGVSYPIGIDETKADDVLKTFEQDFRTCEINRIDNTDVTKYVSGLLGINMDDMSDKLFVDITDRGTFDEESDTFSFALQTGENVVIKQNDSKATVDGKTVDLGGRVAVYVGERFYVPEVLLDIGEQQETSLSIYADYNTKQVTVNGVSKRPDETITLVVTEPEKSIAESHQSKSIVYIGQEKSDENCGFSIQFKVSEGQVGDYNYFTRIGDGAELEEHNFSFKNMTIKKDGVVIDDMSEVESGDAIRLVLNGYDSNYDGIAVIAQYGENGALLGIKTLPVKGSATSYDDEDYIETTVKDNVKSIKAFYWNKSTYAPFTGVYSLSAN